jgi:hypothetical protein
MSWGFGEQDEFLARMRAAVLQGPPAETPAPAGREQATSSVAWYRVKPEDLAALATHHRQSTYQGPSLQRAQRRLPRRPHANPHAE